MKGKESAGLAKVTPPKFERVLVRERLFSLLDRKRERPVIWITGPPGSGKTTLIASYLGAYPIPCLWYDVDEGDADAATFFYYLGVAARQAAPSRHKPLPLLTPEYLPGLSTFTLRYFEDLYEQLKTPAMLVLDNYQQISDDSVFHEIIAGGLARIPRGINVVLVSRTEPPSALIRHRANNLMEEVGWPELRLTLKETEAMIRLQVEEMLPQESVQHLHSITGGWPAGVMLMLKTAQREQVDPRVIGAVSYEHIFDYFAAEILAKTDAQTQQFLLKTAFFPSMTASMAEHLTGLGSAERILSGLHRNNYFTLRYLSNPPAYEYHPLFREFLLTRAKESFAGGEAVEIIQRAALLLEEAGQAEAAIELLCDIAAWDQVVPLIMKHAPEWLSQGRHLRLQEWLARLPVQLVERVPWISYWMGACYMATDPSRSRQYFEQAFERFRAQEETAGLFLAWSGAVDAIFYSFEDFTRFDRWIGILEENTDSFRKLPEEISVRVASSMFTALVIRQPGHPDVEAWKERALPDEESSFTINTKALTLSNWLHYLLFKGDFAKAAADLKPLQQLLRSSAVGPLAQLTVINCEAGYYWIKGLHTKCIQAASSGLELSRKTGVCIIDPFLLGLAANSSLDEEDTGEAEKWIEKMASYSVQLQPWQAAYFYHLKAKLALINQEYRKALHNAELSLKLFLDSGGPIYVGWSHILNAMIQHDLGDHRQASKHLVHASGIADQTGSIWIKFLFLLLEAHFAFDRGDETAGLNALSSSFALGRKHENPFFSIVQPAMVASLCVKALEAGIEVDYARQLIRQKKLTPEKPPLHLDNWPWPVKVHTLGRFELLKDEAPIVFSGKAQDKPLALLQALIAFGGRQIPIDQLTDALWPEADGDMAHLRFKTTLHRLRNLIGFPEAIQLKGGHLTLDHRCCWVDVWALEQILEQITAECKNAKGDKTKVHELTRRALDLYHGPFLPSKSLEPWIISLRARLAGELLQTLQNLAADWEKAGEYEDALVCYQSGIKLDQYAENCHQGLIKCYRHLGRQAEALSACNRLKETFAAADIDPSPQTQSLMNAVFQK